ncbi:MAG: MogA/MoaB family molybdenum cofactor biosynthesis protein [Cetobacterium sp.]|uniref:MogA/MoaB family molybdenum cofactor biosynthesis protein n=1 Tax=unclassified Cetobacterium TaxID=2630983 RepID=UPI00163C152F|nr:MogA/MoaB family molybdenum cofactor biosynthesis protein [Cetobacterium sp. 2A]MBC2856689.1 MogA/MoaB family molybdenum cofactor biosynthesis protein [Cetobacterium sp. 2A]
MIKTAVITLSDKGSRGLREDKTGEILIDFIKKNNNYEVVHYEMLPDDFEQIKSKLIELSDNSIADLIITNGGTGFSKRDVTPEATLAVIEREAQGVAEYMRYKSFEITPKAMGSRARCGIRKNSVILNLPGSPKGALENLSFVIDALVHSIEILKGEAGECATPLK